MLEHVNEFIKDVREEYGEEKIINYILSDGKPHIVHDMNDKMAENMDFESYVAWLLKRLDDNIGSDFYFYSDVDILEELNKDERDLEKILSMLPQ